MNSAAWDVALMLETSCAFFLDLLILVTYFRFSARIDRTLAERALTILKGPVNSSG